MKKCYLAGPMRGYPEFNFPAFFAAAKALRERGYEVWSPAENDVHQDGFNPATDAALPMRHYMKRDLPAVLDADFVAVLPGWEKSHGATCEVTVARSCGIPVLLASDLSEVVTSRPEAQAHNDTFRLDWLQKVKDATFSARNGDKRIAAIRLFTVESQHVNGNTVREAIDNAIHEEQARLDMNGGGEKRVPSEAAALLAARHGYRCSKSTAEDCVFPACQCPPT